MIIAVDASGGDYAPHEIVKGCIKAVQECGVEVALVGRKNVLHVLAGRHLLNHGMTIVDASENIECTEAPLKAIKSKPDSSIVVGINLIRDGQAAAFVSAGSTGAVFAAALLTLGKMEGVERPAIGCFLDNVSASPALLIDAGANAECRPEHLVQFARMGSVFSENILGLTMPRIGLLSNGAEDNKGNRLVQETNELLRKAKEINFIGNIEGHDIARRLADVIVTDGFTGNVVIKTIEGFNDSFLSSARQVGQVLSSAYHLRGHDLLRDIGLGSWVKSMDYREYGGASLVGVNGNVIIAHGRSQAKAIKNAIGLAKQMVERGTIEAIKEEIHEQANSRRR